MYTGIFLSARTDDALAIEKIAVVILIDRDAWRTKAIKYLRLSTREEPTACGIADLLRKAIGTHWMAWWYGDVKNGT